MNEIKLSKVYLRKEDKKAVRVVGWYGDNSLIFEYVKVSERPTYLGWDQSFTIRRAEKKRQLYACSLNKFSETYREFLDTDIKD